MALLVIMGDDGKEHLIHSSQIGPQNRYPRSTGWWESVWERFDAGKIAADVELFSPERPET